MKKYVLIFLSIFLLFILLFSTIIFIDRQRAQHSMDNVVGSGITLMSELKFEEGVYLCSQAKYYGSVCYVTAFGMISSLLRSNIKAELSDSSFHIEDSTFYSMNDLEREELISTARKILNKDFCQKFTYKENLKLPILASNEPPFLRMFVAHIYKLEVQNLQDNCLDFVRGYNDGSLKEEIRLELASKN